MIEIKTMLSLLGVLVVFCLFYYSVHRIAKAFEVPPQIVAIIDVLILIAAVAYLLRFFG